jgi:hypothetical protein
VTDRTDNQDATDRQNRGAGEASGEPERRPNPRRQGPAGDDRRAGRGSEGVPGDRQPGQQHRGGPGSQGSGAGGRGGIRRPRRDDEAPPRRVPDRAPHAPSAPSRGRSDHGGTAAGSPSQRSSGGGGTRPASGRAGGGRSVAEDGASSGSSGGPGPRGNRGRGTQGQPGGRGGSAAEDRRENCGSSRLAAWAKSART